MALLDRLLVQLRTTWPMAAVVAEFVTVQEGQFIVRALVQVGGVPLASGLATAATVEAAEDRAKERAIQALGLSAAPSPTAASSPAVEVPFSGGMTSMGAIAPTPAPVSPSLNLPPLPTPAPVPTPIPTTSPLPTEADEDLAGPVVADLYSHAVHYTPPEEEEEALDPQKVLEQMVPASTLLNKSRPETDAPPPEMKKPRRKEPKAEPPKIPDSVDLSDVIAQTDVELQRLGWSRIQGRDYLLQTYNKKTRSELSELELYEFLSYLKGQPSSASL